MTQMISQSIPDLQQVFAQGTPAPLNVIDSYVEGHHTAYRFQNGE